MKTQGFGVAVVLYVAKSDLFLISFMSRAIMHFISKIIKLMNKIMLLLKCEISGCSLVPWIFFLLLLSLFKLTTVS